MDSTFSASFWYLADTFQDRTALQFPGEAHMLTLTSLRHLADALGSRLLSFGIQCGDTVAHAIGTYYSPELYIVIQAVIRCRAQALLLHPAAYTREELEQCLSRYDTKLLLITEPGEGNQTVAQAAATGLGVPHAIVSLDLSAGRVHISIPSTPGLLGRPAAAASSGGAIAEVVNRAGVPLFQNRRFLENLTSTIPAGSVVASVQPASAGWGSPNASAGAAWRPVTGGGRTVGEGGSRCFVAGPQSEPPHREAAAVRAEASRLKLKDVLPIAVGAVTAVKADAPLFFFYVAVVFFLMSEVFKIKLGRFQEFLKSAGTFLIFCGAATLVIATPSPAFRYTAMAITLAAVAAILAMFVRLSRTPRDSRPPPPSTALDACLGTQSGSPGGINDWV